MTGENPKIDREGIHIDRDLADQIAIEEELDANIGAEYRFPSPERRRIAGWIYLGAAVLIGLIINGGWIASMGLVGLAAWHFASAWPLNINEMEAMTKAASAVDFPIGHSSASVRFVGVRSRPRWSVVMYSATEPPDRTWPGGGRRGHRRDRRNPVHRTHPPRLTLEPPVVSPVFGTTCLENAPSGNREGSCRGRPGRCRSVGVGRSAPWDLPPALATGQSTLANDPTQTAL